MEQLIWAIILSTMLYYLKGMSTSILVTAAILLVLSGTFGLLLVKRERERERECKRKWKRA